MSRWVIDGGVLANQPLRPALRAIFRQPASRQVRRVLAFVVPVDAMDWQTEYDQLRAEVRAYSPELATKPHCVVFSKMDLLGESEPPPIDAPEAFGVVAISAAARDGLDRLTGLWWQELLAMRRASVRRDDHVPLP